jgi:phage FluMu protein Com
MLIKNYKDFTFNGYMNGDCPGCKEWEAPITVKELRNFAQKECHLGRSEVSMDLNAYYLREVWKEYFQCPKCSTKFSVEYSDV